MSSKPKKAYRAERRELAKNVSRQTGAPLHTVWDQVAERPPLRRAHHVRTSKYLPHQGGAEIKRRRERVH